MSSGSFADSDSSEFRFTHVHEVLAWHARKPQVGHKQWTKFKAECLRQFAEAHVDGRRHADLSLTECRPGHIEEFLEPRGFAGHTYNHWLTALTEPFSEAFRKGWIARNPFAGIHRRRGKRGRPPTQSEFELILAGCKQLFFRRPYVFMVHTGARPQDVAQIRAENVDLASQKITLTRHKTSHKVNKPRRLFLDDEMVVLVADLIREAKFGGWIDEPLFRNSRGGPWTPQSLGKYFRDLKFRLRLPKDCKLYGCRHKFCCDLVRAGVPTATVQHLAGHELLATTEVYLGGLADDEDHLLQALSKRPKAG